VTFQEVLKKYFKLSGNMASGLVPEPRYRGRWALARGMTDMEFRSGVEIGTQYGDSAMMWCGANPRLHLTCIDPYGPYRNRRGWQQREDAYMKACKALEPFNVTMIREESLAVVDRFGDESLDFINIDGDHVFDACMQDIIKWVPKVRKGGLIMVHDYCSFRWIDVTHAVDAYVAAHRIDPWYVTPDVSPTVFWERGAERPVRT